MGFKAKRLFSLLLVFVMAFSLVPSAFAAEPAAVEVEAIDWTQDAAEVTFPAEWREGENRFEVVSPDLACVAFVTHADGTFERLFCAIKDEEAGDYVYRVVPQDGDRIDVALKGDTDRDSRITATDVSELNLGMVGQNPNIEGCYILVADVDTDDRATATDVSNINLMMISRFSPIWDIGWVLEDLPLDDPNEDATLTISVDPASVHAGGTVAVSVETDIEGDFSIAYAVKKDGVLVDMDLSGLNSEGGELTMAGPGLYTLEAVAATEAGREISAEPVQISVENNPPVMSDIVATPNYNDTTFGYVERAKVWTDLLATAEDPDGDEVTIHFVHAAEDGTVCISVSGYLLDGDYITGAYAEDCWGAKSDVMYVDFTIDPVDTVPFIGEDPTEAHIGDLFDIYVYPNHLPDGFVLEDAISRWALTIAETNAETGDTTDTGVEVDPAIFDQTLLRKNGGQVRILETGTYVLHAIGVDEHGAEFDMDVMQITILNAIPGDPTITYEQINDDFENPFTDDAKIKVVFTTESIDPDEPDTTEVHWVKDDGTDVILTEGYFPLGDTVIRVYSIDNWGLKSEVKDFTVTTVNSLPVVDVTDDPVGQTYTEDGGLKQIRPIIVSIEDENPVQIRFIDATMTEEEVFDYEGEPVMVRRDSYGHEEYRDTTVTVVDAWNIPVTWQENITSTLAMPFITVDGQTGTAEIHQGFPTETSVDFGDMVADSESVYFVIKDSEGNIVETPAFTIDEVEEFLTTGQLFVEVEPGDYTLCARADIDPDTTEDGNYIDGLVAEIVIHVVNNAPLFEAPAFTAEIDYDDLIAIDNVPYAKVTVTFYSTDFEHHVTEYKFVDTTNELYTGYYANGDYSSMAYAIDEYGAMSETTEVSFTIEIPAITITPPDEFHIGDEFTLETTLDRPAIASVEYVVLDADKNPIDEALYDVSALTAAGGTMSISDGTGVHYIQATITFASDDSIYIIDAPIEITNTVPTIALASFDSVLFNQDEHLMAVTGTFDAEDVDGDDFVIYYAFDSDSEDDFKALDVNEMTFDDAQTLGTHMLYFFIEDEWGLRSEIMSQEVEVGYYLTEDMYPTFEYVQTDEFENIYEEGVAARKAEVTVTWHYADGTTFVMDETKATVHYFIDGEEVADLSTFYTLGDHIIAAYAVDLKNIPSSTGSDTLTMETEAPDVSWVIDPEDGVTETIVDEDMGLIKIERWVDGVAYDGEFNDLLRGKKYLITLTVTDPWGLSTTLEADFVYVTEIPALEIRDWHWVELDPDAMPQAAKVIFDKIATPDDHFAWDTTDEEYYPVFNLDGRETTNLAEVETWLTLEEHTLTVYAQHRHLDERRSEIFTFEFDMTNHAPEAPAMHTAVIRDETVADGGTPNADAYEASTVLTDGCKLSVYCEYEDGRTPDELDEDSAKMHDDMQPANTDSAYVNVYWVDSTGEEQPFNNEGFFDYFGLGQHTVYFFARDIWGAESEQVPVTFEITDERPMVNDSVAIIVNRSTDQYGNDTVGIKFDIDATDPDDKTENLVYRIYIENAGTDYDGEQYYEPGDMIYLRTEREYQIRVVAIDPFNKASEEFIMNINTHISEVDPPIGPIEE